MAMTKYLLGAKALVCAAAVAALVVAVNGCQRKTAENTAGQKITLSAPGNVDIKRGGTAEVKVSISRTNYNEPVKVEITNLPTGVSVETKDMTIAKDQSSGTFTLKARDDAELVTKEATATVTGGDLKVSENFKVTVKDK
jgi:hypothetical protein